MSRRFRVLLVEDEDLVRPAAVASLREAGFEVVEAASGHEALHALAREGALDALLTDIRLGPGPDGWDVALAFRARHADAPVIYLSGFAPGEPRRLSNSLFFPKPYRPSRIIAALHIMLEVGRAEPPGTALVTGPAGLTRLTYMSRPTALAREPSHGEGYLALVHQCRTRNQAEGLTGALLAGPDWFIQVLEGESAALMAALDRINRDPRHEDLRIFELTAAPARLFGEWSMHLGRLEDVEPDLLWRCVEGFRRPGPGTAPALVEALTRSTRQAA